MSQTKIGKLTSEQLALLPSYREKWRSVALSTKLINRKEATEAVKSAYLAIGKQEPEVLFCDSPQGLPKTFTKILQRQLGRMEWLVELYLDAQRMEQLQQVLGIPLGRQLAEQLYNSLRQQLAGQLHYSVRAQLEAHLRLAPYELQWEQLQYNQQLQRHLPDCMILEYWTRDALWFDYCISVLNCTHSQAKWLAFKSLVEHCGWLFPYEKICVVCDRPIQLAFDNEGHLHAEGEPALQFTDGFSVYAFHGLRLPEKYGKIPPYQWRSQWLLEEENAELRHVLIQGIGYERLCRELAATELDSWAEYTLLRIDTDVDQEPILLLKMNCPSTGFIHVSRVPPDVESASSAICWVNWEIAPEEFAIQT